MNNLKKLKPFAGWITSAVLAVALVGVIAFNAGETKSGHHSENRASVTQRSAEGARDFRSGSDEGTEGSEGTTRGEGSEGSTRSEGSKRGSHGERTKDSADSLKTDSTEASQG
ncbi:MAG: hypothetical protein LBN08_00325 [Lactobacillales bacterium]|jgi:hypothetical protein|nr:hypothetical protein [Lactobacillales bacterium]